MGHGLILRRKLVSEASLSPEPFMVPDNIRYCPSFRKDIPIPKVDHPCLTHPFATLPGDCSPFTLDLHVLGTPPAFVLSQDQTLQIHFVPVFHDQGPFIGRCCSYLVVNDPRLLPCVSTGAFSLRGLFSPRKSQPFDPTLKDHPCQPLPPLLPFVFFQVVRRRLVIASSPHFVKHCRKSRSEHIICPGFIAR